MGIVIGQLAVDCADPRALAEWWAQTLGWEVQEDDGLDEAEIVPPDRTGPSILFLRVPEPKTVKNRLHLDVRPADGSDQAAELERLLARGATPIDVGQGDVSWHVLADPGDNEFYLLQRAPSELREG